MHSEKLIHFPEKGCSVTNTEAVTRRCSIKQVILEILQNLQENTCASVSFLIKLQASTCVIKKKCSEKFELTFAFVEIHSQRKQFSYKFRDTFLNNFFNGTPSSEYLWQVMIKTNLRNK